MLGLRVSLRVSPFLIRRNLCLRKNVVSLCTQIEPPEYRGPATRETKPQSVRPFFRRPAMDVLQESIESATDSQTVLNLIVINKKNLREIHISHAFRMLTHLCWKDGDITTMIAAPEFKILCDVTVKKCRYLTTNDLLSVLRGLAHFRIPSNVMVFQSIIHMIKSHVNDFDTRQLIFLDNLLNFPIIRGNKQDPLISAIRMALPMAMEIKLTKNELDWDNCRDVVGCLKFSAFRPLSAQVTNSLISGLIRIETSATSLDRFWIAVALTHHNISHNKELDLVASQGIVNRSLNHLISPASDVSPKMLLDLFFKSFSRSVIYYHSGFVQRIADLVAQQMDTISFEKFHFFLADLMNLGHYDHRVLESFERKIALQKEAFDRDTSICPARILSSFVRAGDYEPKVGWDQFIQTLLPEDKFVTVCHKDSSNVLRVCENLLQINRTPHHIFRHVPQYLERSIETSLEKGNIKLMSERLLTINVGLSRDDVQMDRETFDAIQSKLSQVVPDAIEYLNASKREVTDRYSNLKETIVRALGGDDFVRSYVWTDDGLYLDHLIVMRKGDFPIAIGKEHLELNYLRDITLPEGCKLVTIFPLGLNDYHRKPTILTRETANRIECLKRKGILPLPINMANWNLMQPKEQIPYLMREITHVLKPE